jgi:type IV pilus assembly protein PilN
MIQINLLPWREQARKVNKTRFFIWMSVFIGIALITLLLFHIQYYLIFSNQQKLNKYLESEINQEQIILSALDQQQQAKQALEKQLSYIINLHKTSFRAIKLLNELVSLIPHNISLNKIIRNDNKITLMGSSKTDVDLSIFKQSIAKSPIFNQPVLTEISTEKNSSTINFTLDVLQKDVL